MNYPISKWDLRYLSMAKLVSSWSKDPSTQTGSVIVDMDNRILSLGYNGFAANVEDGPDRYADRSIKYEMIIHCEENAIISADRNRLRGATLYVWPFMPCSRCAAKIINSGIVRCVAPEATEDQLTRWASQFELTQIQFREAKINLKLYNREMLDSL